MTCRSRPRYGTSSRDRRRACGSDESARANRRPAPRRTNVSTQFSVSNGRGKSIRGQISCSPMCWLYVVIIGSSPRSCCILTIEPIGSSIHQWSMSVVVLSAGRSFLISGSPSQQWTGTRSGVPRWKAIRVRSAVFTVDLLFVWGCRQACRPAGMRRADGVVVRPGRRPTRLDLEGRARSCRKTVPAASSRHPADRSRRRAAPGNRSARRIRRLCDRDRRRSRAIISRMLPVEGRRAAGERACCAPRRESVRCSAKSSSANAIGVVASTRRMPSSSVPSRARSASVRRSAARRTIASSITSRASTTSIASIASSTRPDRRRVGNRRRAVRSRLADV